MNRLRENESEDGSVVNRLGTNYAVVLTPTNATVEETIAALENIDNYGLYVSNLRNTKANMQKALEDEFGPSIPSKKKGLEKQRGKPFPPKTKQAIDDFIKSFKPKVDLLRWQVKGNEIIFPKQGNPQKEVVKNMLKTVLFNAAIEYEVADKEINEDQTNRLKKAIKEIILKENKDIKIEPNIAFKIYDILKTKYPQIGKDFTKSAFYSFLDK